jgi:periplasmic protein TonB
MKKNIFLFLFFITTFIYSQEQTPTVVDDYSVDSDSNVYDIKVIDKYPEFPGGVNALYKFVAVNYKMPIANKLSGRVIVNFIVDVDGSITDVRVIKDIGNGTGEEAVRVLNTSPKWSPGIYKEKPVRVRYTLPIALRSN